MVASAVLSLTNWTIGSTPVSAGIKYYVQMVHLESLVLEVDAGHLVLQSVPMAMIMRWGPAMLMNAGVPGPGIHRTIYLIEGVTLTGVRG